MTMTFAAGKTWTTVPRCWYHKAADNVPTTGRLYHHLAILARLNVIQQLYHYTKSSTTCYTPALLLQENGSTECLAAALLLHQVGLTECSPTTPLLHPDQLDQMPDSSPSTTPCSLGRGLAAAILIHTSGQPNALQQLLYYAMATKRFLTHRYRRLSREFVPESRPVAITRGSSPVYGFEQNGWQLMDSHCRCDSMWMHGFCFSFTFQCSAGTGSPHHTRIRGNADDTMRTPSTSVYCASSGLAAFFAMRWNSVMIDAWLRHTGFGSARMSPNQFYTAR
ncbi:hypothetical protein HDV57DRAFT_80618 [Trichoderma longibrachiatum]|uniref:Uncharacterized protein n=1 Tax=Trichoderma longibrachiatum ATCC 18648 TaxID=983965 RepID=A0A2T4BV45_TRILO|nr:hypothetical protein M440DRAFT_347350 [Trichoderma longibrachiatum ATCC 18648]